MITRVRTTALTRVRGGQVMIHHWTTDDLFSGEIASAEVQDDVVSVRLAWLAKNDGTHSQPSANWTLQPNHDLRAPLEIYFFEEICSWRLSLTSTIMRRTYILSSKTTSFDKRAPLARKYVKGLPELPPTVRDAPRFRTVSIRQYQYPPR